ncbi:MAG TPA: hypothetical protein PK199_09730, partial [Bacteroidales bacterium]|nr:hypothetical protein [Bacteroidales bacterium]
MISVGIPSIKILYYLLNYSRLLIPKCFFRWRLSRILFQIEHHTQYASIVKRVEYYNTLSHITSLDS